LRRHLYWIAERFRQFGGNRLIYLYDSVDDILAARYSWIGWFKVLGQVLDYVSLSSIGASATIPVINQSQPLFLGGCSRVTAFSPVASPAVFLQITSLF
jgi:hypothetical protein